ncbi:MAG: tRNA preQ1(34) S-adenosylmethionine ribosyltransferase-isomerase QueA [Geminicoccaceae bacterium]|nr:tRNA preQ1(34) S-adenosylmethionine ribosyltransferase-isomerase QueA [Geminicoccaceae bacterium]
MRVDLFDFDLPPGLIAQAPAEPRDAARLLQIGRGVEGERLAIAAVRDLPDLLRPGDLLLVNDTKVLPVRFAASRLPDGAPIEVTLTERTDGRRWLAFLKPGRKVRTGDRLRLAEGLEAVCEGKEDDGRGRLRFDAEGEALTGLIRARGRMPLPPYIRTDDEAGERASYQTLFAAHEGAVAAPTAGLHFTEGLLARLDARGIERAALTLHVGLGTFQPVKVDDTADHVMHAESYAVPEATASAFLRAKGEGRRVVACGTTVLRTLESAFDPKTGGLRTGPGTTGLFMTPGHRFRTADLLLTNFHLPRSTLFMLVAAFAGLETMRRAYAHAIEERLRFFSYGDACLIERAA